MSFDIMIVYDAHLAHSAADPTYREAAPFSSNGEYFNCNATYQYFIEYCKEQGLQTAFTTTHDIAASGQFKSIWIYTTRWERVQELTKAKVIFDKFSNLLTRNHAAYKLLTTILEPLPLLHNQAMRIMFDNKLETYLQFPNYTIPTVQLDSLAPTSIEKAERALAAQCRVHPYRDDFGSDLVLKDQFGLGGNQIYKITDEADFAAVPYNPATHYILQPLIQASGFVIDHYTGSSDLRVIICNDQIIQSYLRVAKTGEFRANAQQGGELIYLTLDKIPADVLTMITEIKQRLPSQTALYTLDFIKSNHGHLYFIEGNNSPGLNWFDREDETRAKELIHLLVNNLQQLILQPKH